MARVFRIEKIEPRPMMAVRMQFPVADANGALEKMFTATNDAIAAAGLKPSGPPFSIYHAWDNTLGDVESGMLVAKPVSDGDVKAGMLPGGQAIVTVHTGPYYELVPAYAELRKWMLEQGHTIDGPPHNIFLTDPKETNPEKFKTRIVQPIAAPKKKAKEEA